VKIQLPIKIKVDNMGAVYMSENISNSSRTRHLDTRIKYIASLQEEGLIKVEFIRSEENGSDIATKNVIADLFEVHIKQLVADKSEVYRNGN
jgi:hypothetical protein